MLKSLARITALSGLVSLVPFITLYALGTAPVVSQSGAVAIGGYCPVAYVAMKQAVKGSAAHTGVYQGRTYHLTNADAKKMFDAERRIVELIARGGMGEVYRATDTRLRRDVAVKVLAPTQTGDVRRVERFLHEARSTAGLDHQNIVRVARPGSCSRDAIRRARRTRRPLRTPGKRTPTRGRRGRPRRKSRPHATAVARAAGFESGKYRPPVVNSPGDDGKRTDKRPA